jgi:hypothetical protein
MSNESEFIDKLEIRLSDLAIKWRSTHFQGNLEDASKAIEEYHSTMDQLWLLGWDGEVLPPEAELPDELMPQYFIEYWQRKNNIKKLK